VLIKRNGFTPLIYSVSYVSTVKILHYVESAGQKIAQYRQDNVVDRCCMELYYIKVIIV